jgi:cholesterol transport system auxiliary component
MKIPTIGLALFFVTACSVLPKTQPPPALHDFGLTLPTSADGMATQPKVRVSAPEWLADNRIHYRLLYAAPTQVRFYANDRWIAPPNALLEQLFSLESSRWHYPISLKLQVFEQQFEAPGQAKAILRFTAITTPTRKGDMPRKKDFLLQKACPTADAKGAVTAFADLAKQAVADVSAWLDKGV